MTRAPREIEAELPYDSVFQANGPSLIAQLGAASGGEAAVGEPPPRMDRELLGTMGLRDPDCHAASRFDVFSARERPRSPSAPHSASGGRRGVAAGTAHVLLLDLPWALSLARTSPVALAAFVAEGPRTDRRYACGYESDKSCPDGLSTENPDSLHVITHIGTLRYLGQCALEIGLPNVIESRHSADLVSLRNLRLPPRPEGPSDGYWDVRMWNVHSASCSMATSSSCHVPKTSR